MVWGWTFRICYDREKAQEFCDHGPSILVDLLVVGPSITELLLRSFRSEFRSLRLP
jgi:hypothetical protein